MGDKSLARLPGKCNCRLSCYCIYLSAMICRVLVCALSQLWCSLKDDHQSFDDSEGLERLSLVLVKGFRPASGARR